MQTRFNFFESLNDWRIVFVKDLPNSIPRSIGIACCVAVVIYACVEATSLSNTHLSPDQSDIAFTEESLVSGRPFELVVNDQKHVVGEFVELSPPSRSQGQTVGDIGTEDAGNDWDYYFSQLKVSLLTGLAGGVFGWITALWQKDVYHLRISRWQQRSDESDKTDPPNLF
jgi:hypothetical protein